MRKVTAEELERLRVAEAVKREAGVTEHILPRSRISELEASRHARSHPGMGIIRAPKGRTQVGLAVLAHEAGHVATQPPRQPPDDGEELVYWEYAATAWGLKAIARNGGTITKRMVNDSRKALWTYVAGLDVDPRALPAPIFNFLVEGTLA